MAFYKDIYQNYYISSYRASQIIKGDKIGGIFRIDSKKIPTMHKLLKFISLISLFFLIANSYLLKEGWPSNQVNQLVIGIISFIPFLFIVCLILYISNPRSMIILNNKTISISLIKESIYIHIISAIASLNIFSMFISIIFSTSEKDIIDISLLSILVVFWIAYFFWNLCCLCRIRSL